MSAKARSSASFGSHLVSATRDLANQGVVTSQVGWTLLAGLAVIVVFAPLSVHSYRRHM